MEREKGLAIGAPEVFFKSMQENQNYAGCRGLFSGKNVVQ